MTKQEAIAAHRKMWRWIADETERRKYAVKKSEYFDAMGIPEENRPSDNCYCCEYVMNHNRTDCDLCPIEWPGRHCFGGRGLYKKWVDASDNDNWAEAAALALVIAELPEREDIKDETD